MIEPPPTKTATRREPEDKPSHLVRNISLLLIVAALVWYAFVVSSGRNPLNETRAEVLTPSQFTVKAGTIYYVRFNVGSAGRVVGRFEASGGQGNDVQVVVANADGFDNWRNGHAAQVLYQTGKTTVGTLNVPITQPGTYYLGFNNKFSLVSDKTVSGQIQLYY
jgi:hypothetical protein